METWKKLLLAAGGTVGVAAVIYYLLKEEPDTSRQLLDPSDVKKKAGVAEKEITKEQFYQILQEIIKSQGQMKGYMDEITQQLLREKFTFEQTYNKVKAVFVDPLEKYGLSMMDFDQLLDKHKTDPRVEKAIPELMGATAADSCTSAKAQSVSVKKIIDIHKYMLEMIGQLNNDFQALPNRASFDMRVVPLTAQTIVGSKIEQKFGLTSEDIQSAVAREYKALEQDQEFMAINMNLQFTMANLMGTHFQQDDVGSRT